MGMTEVSFASHPSDPFVAGNAQGSAPKSDVLKHIELLEGKYKVPVVAFTPPKFEPGDPAALAYLDEHGYVVFGGAASPDEAKQSVDMFWTHLETETGGKVLSSASISVA